MGDGEDSDLLPEEQKYASPILQKTALFAKIRNRAGVSRAVLRLWIQWRNAGKPMLKAGGMLDQPAYLWGKMWELESILDNYLKLKRVTDKEAQTTRNLDALVIQMQTSAERKLREK